MGEKRKKIRRVVLDTNVLISALLFEGEVSRLVVQWQMGVFPPVISKATFKELETALSYPKFHLSSEEIRMILTEEILPFFEVVEVKEKIEGVCRDAADDKFISCALSAGVEVIVTGDKDLMAVKKHRTVRIVSASDFLRMME